MTASYAQHVSTRQTPQTEKIPGSNQVPNAAGGWSHPVDDWALLNRFLVLGAEGGTFYATERALTKEMAAGVQRCIEADGHRTVKTIVEVSEAGRAPKNDAAIFALALCASWIPKTSRQDEKTWLADSVREAAFKALPRVCRIGTHLFQFVAAIDVLRGWGRSTKKGVASWYDSMTPQNLAHQVTKYQQRNEWSHRDVMRLCHWNKALAHRTARVTGADDRSRLDVFNWVAKGWPGVGADPHPDTALLSIWALEKAKRATSTEEIVRLIVQYRLPRECIPTQFLSSPEVWHALLIHMPLTALIRNLGKMTSVGLLAPLSAASMLVVTKLGNGEYLRSSRVHPLALLVALKIYQQGHGDKGSLTWTPVPQVIDALDRAFYAAFDTVEPTNQRWFLAVDHSGSMCSPDIAGMPGINPRVGAAAMALVTASTEKQYFAMSFGTSIHALSITPRQRLDDVTMAMVPEGTDCSLPFLLAAEQKIPVDVFAVYTDSQSWAGNVMHASQALDQYRQRMGIGAKAICVAMVANECSILDPNDAGSLNVAGFDTAAPSVMSGFARGDF